VNWTCNCLLKESGGLEIPNLEKFVRVLRLRWLWHQGVSPDKPLVGTETPCNDEDKLLFATCTTITLLQLFLPLPLHAGCYLLHACTPNTCILCKPANMTQATTGHSSIQTNRSAQWFA
jgi:hypothetical protein